jgi:Tn3 transposase DDE domain
VYEQKRAAGDHAAMDLIRRMSPVAWQHVNLFGSFEFNPTNSPIDMDALAAYYADPAYWKRILRAAEIGENDFQFSGG